MSMAALFTKHKTERTETFTNSECVNRVLLRNTGAIYCTCTW
jgi:hypothetical protein